MDESNDQPPQSDIVLKDSNQSVDEDRVEDKNEEAVGAPHGGNLFGCCGGASREAAELIVKDVDNIVEHSTQNKESLEDPVIIPERTVLGEEQGSLRTSKTRELSSSQEKLSQGGSCCCGRTDDDATEARVFQVESNVAPMEHESMASRAGGPTPEKESSAPEKESSAPEKQPTAPEKQPTTVEGDQVLKQASKEDVRGGSGWCCGGAAPPSPGEPTSAIPGEDVSSVPLDAGHSVAEMKRSGSATMSLKDSLSHDRSSTEAVEPPMELVPGEQSTVHKSASKLAEATGGCCGCCATNEPEFVVGEGDQGFQPLSDLTEQQSADKDHGETGAAAGKLSAAERALEPADPEPPFAPAPVEEHVVTLTEPTAGTRPLPDPVKAQEEEIPRATAAEKLEPVPVKTEPNDEISSEVKALPPTFEKSPVFLPHEIGTQPVLPPPTAPSSVPSESEADEDAAIFASSDADKLDAYRKKYPDEDEVNLQRWATSVGCYMTYDAGARGFFSSVWSDKPLHNAIAFFNIGDQVSLPTAKIRSREKSQLTSEKGNQKKVLKSAFIAFCKLCARYDGDFVIIPSRIWMTEALGSVEVVWLDVDNHLNFCKKGICPFSTTLAQAVAVVDNSFRLQGGRPRQKLKPTWTKSALASTVRSIANSAYLELDARQRVLRT